MTTRPGAKAGSASGTAAPAAVHRLLGQIERQVREPGGQADAMPAHSAIAAASMSTP